MALERLGKALALGLLGRAASAPAMAETGRTMGKEGEGKEEEMDFSKMKRDK